MKMKIKYLYFVISIILLAVVVSAYQFQTIYNPFTGKLDYYVSNYSGENVSFHYICLDDDTCINIWPAGGGGAGDKWVDGGAYIYPNGTFADNIKVFGYIQATDWSNVTRYYYPRKVNLTTGTQTPNAGGYASANVICDSNYSGSHVCNEFEIASWFANGGGRGVTGDAWIIGGSPKYAPADLPVNDCNGFTHGSAGIYLGNYWHFNKTEMGDGRCVNCGTSLAYACCSY